jgi:hypothetical protein
MNMEKKLDFGKMGDKEWAFCILSDAQEHLSRIYENNSDARCANELINKAKKCLMGKYTTDGYAIEVD